MKLITFLILIFSFSVFSQYQRNTFGVSMEQILGNKITYDKTKIGIQGNGYHYYIIEDEEFDSAFTFVYKVNLNGSFLRKSTDVYGNINQWYEIDLKLNPAYNFIMCPWFGFISPYARYTDNADRRSMVGGMGFSISSGGDWNEGKAAYYVHAGGLFGKDLSNKLIENFNGDLTYLEYTYKQNSPIETTTQYVVTRKDGTVKDNLAQILNDFPDKFDTENVEVKEISRSELLELEGGFYISLGVLEVLTIKDRPLSLQLDISSVNAKARAPGTQTSMSPVDVSTTTEIINGQTISTDTYTYSDVTVITNSGNNVKYNRFDLNLNSQIDFKNFTLGLEPSLGLEKVQAGGTIQRRKNFGLRGSILVNF